MGWSCCFLLLLTGVNPAGANTTSPRCPEGGMGYRPLPFFLLERALRLHYAGIPQEHEMLEMPKQNGSVLGLDRRHPLQE